MSEDTAGLDAHFWDLNAYLFYVTVQVPLGHPTHRTFQHRESVRTEAKGFEPEVAEVERLDYSGCHVPSELRHRGKPRSSHSPSHLRPGRMAD